MEIETEKTQKSQSFWIPVNFSFAPLTSNQIWHWFDHFWAGNFDKIFLLVLPQKILAKKFHFIWYWLRFIICYWECACVACGEWVLLGEGEYDYKQFSSISLMHVLCIIFTNADSKISLMDYIVLPRLPWCFTQQADSKTPVVQICDSPV